MIIKRHPFMNLLWIHSFIWSKFFHFAVMAPFFPSLTFFDLNLFRNILLEATHSCWNSLLELDYFLRWAFLIQLILWWNVVLQFWVLQLWNQTAQFHWPFSAWLFFDSKKMFTAGSEFYWGRKKIVKNVLASRGEFTIAIGILLPWHWVRLQPWCFLC